MSKSYLPPVPASVLRYEKRHQERIQGLSSLLRQGPSVPRSQTYDDPTLDAVGYALDAAKAGQFAPDTVERLQAAGGQGGFWKGLLRALDTVSLPFQAFAEGLTGLTALTGVGPEPFERRGAASRDVLRRLFSGDISPAQAMGLLRDVSRQRSSIEQLLTGFLFDPLNLLIPLGVGSKAVLAGRTLAQAAAAAGRSAVAMELPIIGPKILRRLGLQEAAGLVKEQAIRGVTGPEDLPLVAGAAADPGALAGKVLADAAHLARQPKRPGQVLFLEEEQLQKLYEAARQSKNPLRDEVRLRLSHETGGRPGEIYRLRGRSLYEPGKSLTFEAAKGPFMTPSAPLSDETWELLTQYVRREKLGPDDFLFPRAETDAVFARRLTVAAKIPGGEKIVDNIFRTSLATNLARQGVDPWIIMRVMRHTSFRMTRDVYIKAGVPLPEDITSALLEGVAPRNAARAKEAEDAWRAVAGQGARPMAVPPSKGLTKKGGMTLRHTRQRQWFQVEGEEKIANLGLPEATAAAVDTISQPGLRERVALFLRTAAAGRLIQRGRNLELQMNINRSMAKGADLAQVKRELAQIRIEVSKLASGVERIHTFTLKDRTDVLKALERLFETDRMREMDAAFDAAVSFAKTWLDPARVIVRGAGGRFPRKWLAERGLTRADVLAKPVLPDIETFLDDVQTARAVQAWVEYPGIQDVLKALDIGVVEEAVEGGAKALFLVADPSDLHRALRWLGEHESTQHLLGTDFVALSDAAKATRIRVLFNHLVGRVKYHPDAAAARAAKALGLEEVPRLPPELPEPPILGRTPPTEPAALATYLVEPIQTVEHISKFVATSPKMTAVRKWAASAELNTHGMKLVQLGGRLLRDMIEVTAGAGATASKAVKVGIGMLGAHEQAVRLGEQIRLYLRGMPGYRTLIREGMSEDGILKSLTVQPNVPRAIVEKATAKGLGLASIEDALRHVKSVFDPGVVPDDMLRVVYNMTAEEERLILTARNVVRQGTVQAKALGLDIEAKVAGKFLGDLYFPTMEASRELMPIAARISAQPQAATISFLKERVLVSAAQALYLGHKYHDPVEAVARLTTDMLVLANEAQARTLLKSLSKPLSAINGSTEQIALLRQVAQTISKGRRALVAMEDMEEVKGLSLDFKEDALRANLGAIVDEVLKGPSEAKAVLPEIEQVLAQLRTRQQHIRDLAALTKGTPGLEGTRYFDDLLEAKDVAAFWNQGRETLIKPLQMLSGASALLRFFVAGIDLSAVGIHLLPLLARRSTAPIFMRAAKHMFGVWLKPGAHEAFRRAKFDSIRSFVRYGGVTGFAEPVEAGGAAIRLLAGKPLTKETFRFLGRDLPRRVQPGLPGLQQVERWLGPAERSEAAFTAATDAARIYLWEALSPLAKADEAQLRGLAAFVNKATGAYNPTLAGFPKFQRQIETLLFSFAPMYRRATYGLLVDVFRGGLRGSEARKTLGAMALAGAAFIGIAEALGNKDAHNPFSARFGAMRVGGAYVGVGTAYYSLARATMSVGRQLVVEPEAFLKPDPRDNQLLKWWRSQAPPFPGMGIDLILGSSYIGEPLRTEEGTPDWGHMLYWGLSQTAPILVESLARDLRGPQQVALVGEGLGLRAYPISLYDQRSNMARALIEASDDPEIARWRSERHAQGKAIELRDMPIALQKQLKSAWPDLAELDQKIEAESAVLGRGVEKQIVKYMREVRANRDLIDKGPDGKSGLRGLANAFAKGLIDPDDFRAGISEAGAALRALQQAAAKRYPQVITELQRIALERKPDETYRGDVLFAEYMQRVVQNENNTTEDGIFIPANYAAAELDFKKKYGMEVYRYVQKRRGQARDVPQLVKEYWDARETLRPYWETYSRVWPEGSWQRDLVETYYSLTRQQQQIFTESNRRVAPLIARVERARTAYRKAHPEIDWLLVQFYGYKPLTQLAQERLSEQFAFQATFAAGS